MTKTASFHDLKDKSVFITGGGSGIGAALTEGFLAQGARVAFVQRSDGSDFCDEMEARHARLLHPVRHYRYRRASRRFQRGG